MKVADTALMPGGWESLDSAVLKALPLLAAYQVGGCERVFEMTLEYANSRVQFGLPIGRFQRVQDHVIQIVNLKDAARWTTYEALWKLDEKKPDARSSVHVCKAVVSEAYYQACKRRPRSPRRRGYNARVRVDPAHPNVENSYTITWETPSITRPAWPRSWDSNPRLP